MTESRNRRILVIDDNSAIHEDFKKILGRRSRAEAGMDDLESSLFGEAPKDSRLDCFEIDSAFQGREGVECVQRAAAKGQTYAMAFVDIRMPPGWDGIETTAKIWEIDPGIQIVICTAYSDYSWDQMLARLGQSDRLVILKKPFDNIEVQQLAQALTRKWQLAQELGRKLNDLETMVRTRTTELVAANESLKKEIEERRQAEAESRTLQTQLHEAQKLEAVGQLAAGIAHEINTPTQYIGDNTRFVQDGFAALTTLLSSHQAMIAAARQNALTPAMLRQAEELLAASDMKYLCEQIPSAIRETLEGVDRVAKIVRAMKEFSHPGTREKAPADLNHAIESTVAVSRGEWRYVADVNLDLDPALPAVPCYLGEFNQCMLNLIVNAAHAIQDAVAATPGGKGLITVQTARVNGHVEVRVRDTGTGIAQSVRPHIFEPFFTTKGVGKGTGQGLAMVYGCIVKKHGGTVHFETEIGKGTTFFVRLPVAAPVHAHGRPG
jgi:two-component system NtrC family sensor kinase